MKFGIHKSFYRQNRITTLKVLILDDELVRCLIAFAHYTALTADFASKINGTGMRYGKLFKVGHFFKSEISICSKFYEFMVK